MLKAYQEMMSVYSNNAVAKRGSNEFYSYQNAVCFKKSYQGKEMLIMANVRNQQTTVSFPLILQNTVWKDALKGIADTLRTSVVLAPYEYRILMH